VTFLGSGSLGVPTLAALHAAGLVHAVVSQPDRPAGRGLKLVPTPMSEWALANGVRLIRTENANEGEALQAVQQAGGLPGAELWVATDVETLFLDAARVFAPQKGADEAVVERLSHRLEELAQRYQKQFGVEVSQVPGSGAAGGLAGGLLVLGAQIQSGFAAIAQAVGLERAMQEAEVVVTGEGRLDLTSLEGKVVGGVLRLGRPGQRVLVVVGQALPQAVQLAQRLGEARVTVVSLSERFGPEAAMERTLPLIKQVVGEYLAGLGW
jgi:glycerate kinase